MNDKPFSSTNTENAQFFAFRLAPGQDLKKQLIQFATDKKLLAGALVTCVGSLKVCEMRLAGADRCTSLPGPLEIVSLVGTLETGYGHFHISVADTEGKVTGGHLMPGSIVHTTCEIVLMENLHLKWSREPDPTTGYKELKVLPRG